MSDSQGRAPRGFETLCVHEGVAKDQTFNSVTTPIYPTTTFAFEGPGRTKGYDYSRTANPTRTALEECVAALEGGARTSATATGRCLAQSLFLPES